MVGALVQARALVAATAPARDPPGFTSYSTPFNLVSGAGDHPAWEIVLASRAETADECEALCANATVKPCNSYTWCVRRFVSECVRACVRHAWLQLAQATFAQRVLLH